LGGNCSKVLESKVNRVWTEFRGKQGALNGRRGMIWEDFEGKGVVLDQGSRVSAPTKLGAGDSRTIRETRFMNDNSAKRVEGEKKNERFLPLQGGGKEEEQPTEKDRV